MPSRKQRKTKVLFNMTEFNHMATQFVLERKQIRDNKDNKKTSQS